MELSTQVALANGQNPSSTVTSIMEICHQISKQSILAFVIFLVGLMYVTKRSLTVVKSQSRVSLTSINSDIYFWYSKLLIRKDIQGTLGGAAV